MFLTKVFLDLLAISVLKNTGDHPQYYHGSEKNVRVLG